MQNSFDSREFVNRIGKNLVVAFDNARQLATTPELVGDAMEHPVMEKLGQILPNGIGIGSGCVIDTKGATSRQMDVVLYERDICPVFCVNNSPETTYYPCEGVIAVGEVKSKIGKTWPNLYVWRFGVKVGPSRYPICLPDLEASRGNGLNNDETEITPCRGNVG